MIDKEILVITLGTSLVPSIYILGLQQLMIEVRYIRILIFSLLLFAVTGITLFLVNKISIGMMLALLSPIYHFVLFRLFYDIFVNYKKRAPIDVVFNFSKGLFWDRVFAIVFCLFAIFSSSSLIGYFIWDTAK